MIQSGKENQQTIAPQCAVVLRDFTRAFERVTDFNLFLDTLRGAVAKIPWFESACLQFASSGEIAEENAFEAARLALPLTGRHQVHGVLKIGTPSDGRPFGPSDLHLLGALAGFIATLVDEGVERGELQQNEQMLRFLLNQMPVGVVCFSAQRQLLAVNEAARRLLTGFSCDGADELWQIFAEAAPAGAQDAGQLPAHFYLALGGRLLFGETRETPAAHGRSGVSAVLLSDLTIHLAELKEALARETYRCQWLGLRLSFLLLQAKGKPGTLLRTMPDLVENLMPGERCGPVDAHSLGLIFPEADRMRALEFLRHVRPLLPAAHWQVGVAELGADGDSPENLLAAAWNNLKPAGQTLRRTLLLHDDYGAVNDMIELVLRRDFNIVKSDRFDRSMEMLATRAFDGIFSELELVGENDGISLLRRAREFQPALRTFLTTAAYRAPSDFPDLPPETVIVRKPFDVKRLRTTVLDALPL